MLIMKTLKKQFPTESAMQSFAAEFAQALMPGLCIYLVGDLGVGKTAFVRAVLQAMGVEGRVKSPTYTLVEPYEINDQALFHFDLYRVEHADELLSIGIHDYFTPHSICLIEWPEKGAPHLPSADLICEFSFQPEGRALCVAANTARGEEVLGNARGNIST
jgi:tRNA threonylcarbamoyladenosine biosynthesis protein TsaE